MTTSFPTRRSSCLSAATAGLSGLSSCAGIVLVPKREPGLRQFGFVPLSERQALAVLVGDDGSVENRVVDLPPGIGLSSLTEAANYVSRQFAGLTLAEAHLSLQQDIDAGRAALDSASRQLVERGLALRSEARRVGKECVSTCRSRGEP